MSEVIKVKRDGPRGWHWIAAANFDPAIHEVYLDIDQMARDEIVKELRARDISFDGRARVDTLRDILKGRN